MIQALASRPSLKIISCLFAIFLMSSCLKLKHRGSNIEQPNQVRPPVTQSTTQTQTPVTEANLSSEKLKISAVNQTAEMNAVDAGNAQTSIALSKNFYIRPSQTVRVRLDRESVQSSQCLGAPLAAYEVKFMSSEGSSDLRQLDTVLLHANVDYALAVRLLNSGKCQNVSYRFAIIGSLVGAPTPVPVSRLITAVNCDWVDGSGFLGKLQFDPGYSSILIQNAINSPFIVLYGDKIACGVQPNNNALKCDPSSQFNGDAYSKNLACNSVNFFGGGETPVSAGALSFSLRSGQGSLACSAYGTPRATLTLKACKPATDIVENGE